MPRRPSAGSAGLVFHVVNRGVRRMKLFDNPADYAAFQQLLARARQRVPLTVFVYCLMSNHFHLVVRNENDGDLPQFMRWLCGTHAKRFHARRGSTGTGAVYQARYRAFPVQTDGHFLRVCRYVERNPVRANLVSRAEHWRWSSLGEDFTNCPVVTRDPWPVLPPADWIRHVNTAQTLGELAAVRECVKKSRPFGEATWTLAVADRLSLRRSLRSPGRPLIPGRPERNARVTTSPDAESNPN
jgi:putative transposase